MGMALTSCTVPAAGKPTFDLGEDEMEIGIGIHGEPGRERGRCEPAPRSSRRSADAVVEDLPFAARRPRARLCQRHGRHSAHRAYVVYAEMPRDPGERRASPSRATWSATTSRRWRWRAAPSRCCALDDEMTRLWDAPVRHARPARALRRCDQRADAPARVAVDVAAAPRMLPRASRDRTSRSSTQRSATPTTASTWTAASRGWWSRSTASPRRPDLAAASSRPHVAGADLDGRRRVGAAVRDVVSAGERELRGRRRRGRAAAASQRRSWRACGSAAGRSGATRP